MSWVGPGAGHEKEHGRSSSMAGAGKVQVGSRSGVGAKQGSSRVAVGFRQQQERAGTEVRQKPGISLLSHLLPISAPSIPGLEKEQKREQE